MAENIHQTLEQSQELEHVSRSKPVVALAAAIIAVLASLGTLFSHHASITALNTKSEAILSQARMFDTLASAEAKSIRSNLNDALLKSGIAQNPAARDALAHAVTQERAAAENKIKLAEDFEKTYREAETKSEIAMRSYETLEWATAIFETSIVLVSISALTSTRLLFAFGLGATAIGFALLVYGTLQGGAH